MQIILLSGGSGKKLWPLTNDIQAKQFIPLFKDSSGFSETMIQRIYRQITTLYPKADITVATFRSQTSVVRNQLGEEVHISVEPARKSTFPATVLASQYLKNIRKIDENETVVVCPVALYMEDVFFQHVSELSGIVEDRDGIAILGTEAHGVRPEYGCIIPEDSSLVSRLRSFTVSAGRESTEKLVSGGALYNAGFFAFKLGKFLGFANRILDYRDYDELFSTYDSLPACSLEQILTEQKLDSPVYVLRGNEELNDLGTWEAISSVTGSNIIGDGYVSDSCESVNVINNTGIPVLAVGLKNLVISASQQGILVASKGESTDISPYVEHIRGGIMFAQKSWGSFHVLDAGEDSMTIKLRVLAGHHMSYHSHEHRDESWTILSGTGRTIVDGMEQLVGPGDVITMEAGCRHTIFADSDLAIIEIQRGQDISVSDKKKFALE